MLSVVDSRNRFESPSSGLSADAWLEAERERAGTAIDATVAELPDDVSVETTQREGVPKTEIVDAVTETGGPRRDGDPRPHRPRPLPLGSVAERSSASRRCRC